MDRNLWWEPQQRRFPLFPFSGRYIQVRAGKGDPEDPIEQYLGFQEVRFLFFWGGGGRTKWRRFFHQFLLCDSASTVHLAPSPPTWPPPACAWAGMQVGSQAVSLGAA